MLVTVRGFVLLETGCFSETPGVWHRFFKQIDHIVALSFFQAVMFIKHVMVAGELAHFPVPVCNNGYQRLITDKLPNQACNLT